MLSRGIDRDKNNLRTVVKTGVFNLARSKGSILYSRCPTAIIAQRGADPAETAVPLILDTRDTYYALPYVFHKLSMLRKALT